MMVKKVVIADINYRHVPINGNMSTLENKDEKLHLIEPLKFHLPLAGN